MTLPFNHNNEDQHEDEPENQQEEDEDLLTLQLFTGNTSTKSPQQSPLVQTSTHADLHATSTMEPHMTSSSPQSSTLLSYSSSSSTQTTSVSGSAFRASSNRSRRSSAQLLRDGKTEHIAPPYPWATTKRAIVCSLRSLHSEGINTISGEVQCKKCNATYELEFDLDQKLQQVASYVSQNKSTMRDRAPRKWRIPTLPDCKLCGEADCMKPLITDKKRSINWLFLLLGQMLGLCKLSQLKYFCKHTQNHRTGAKDRVLYLTYLELLNQLDPSGGFDA